MYRYSLIVVRTTCPSEDIMPSPPPVVEHVSNELHFLPQWENPEDVPLPPAEAAWAHGNEQIQLHYRVGRVVEQPTLLDALPKDAVVDLQVGGRNYYRRATRVPAAQAPHILCDLLTQNVKDANNNPHLKLRWECTEISILRVEFPSGTVIDWQEQGYLASLNFKNLEVTPSMITPPDGEDAFEVFSQVNTDLQNLQNRIRELTNKE